jgi:hypothetical protein
VSINLSGAQWFKSSRSAEAKACVAVAFLGEGHVGVRDSKNPSGPALIFAPTEWDAFTSAVQGGRLDNA